MSITSPPFINYQELVREDDNGFWLSGRVYQDPAIFEDEMEKIFTRGWVFIGHESEIPEPGDYRTRFIGRQPVILSRDEDRQVHLLMNRCTHRSATVCQEEGGNSSYFRCAYHGWVFSNKGELSGVPHPGGYSSRFFRAEHFGLKKVPRVASHRGFIFASLSSTGQPFDDYLGKAKAYLDRFCDLAPEGEIQASAGRLTILAEGNWKMQLENLTDNYHVQSTHATGLAARRRNQRDLTSSTDWENPLHRQRDLGGGHTVLDRFAFNRSVDDPNDRITGATGTLDREVIDGVARRLGQQQAEHNAQSGPPHIMVFPNLMVLWSAYRMIQPVAYNKTYIHYYPVMLKGASEEVNARRLRQTLLEFGPAGFIAPDDVDMYSRIQTGTEAKMYDWSVLNRGLDTEVMETDEFGQEALTTQIMDEITQRGIWRHYKQVMMQP